MPSVVFRSACPSAWDAASIPAHAAKLGGEGVARQVHVHPVRDPAADETCRLELAVPPAMDCLRARALLGIGTDGEFLLALRAASVIDLLGRIEEVIVGLRRSADVGEIGAEEEVQLGDDRPAEWEHPLLLTLPVDPERAALRVEVADLDASQLRSPHAEEEQAEEREAVAWVLGDREEPGPRISRKKWRDALVSARAPDPRRRRDRDVALLLGPAPESAHDGGDLLARSWRALAPEVDDVAQVVDGDVDR